MKPAKPRREWTFWQATCEQHPARHGRRESGAAREWSGRSGEGGRLTITTTLMKKGGRARD